MAATAATVAVTACAAGIAVVKVGLCRQCAGQRALPISPRSTRTPASTGSGAAAGGKEAPPVVLALQQVGPEAPTARRFVTSSREPRVGPVRFTLVGDQLLIAQTPGKADETVPLAGAQVTVQGTAVVLLPKLAPSATLWMDTAAEAETWGAKFREVARAHRPPAGAGPAPAGGGGGGGGTSPTSGAAAETRHPAGADCTAVVPAPQQQQRAQSARIAELENRVAATLRAAVDRAQRIRELEALVQESAAKDSKIRELEDKVEVISEQASARAERIRELEASLAVGGAARDPVASAVLEDAMRFAEQMLQDREELVIDGGSAVRLREAVDAVKEAKPVVDQQVAELIRRLVAALRWPLALQQRLSAAEQTVREQRALQDQVQQELKELQKKQALEEVERSKAELEVASLRKQLTLAEEVAREAAGRVEDLHSDSRRSEQEVATLRGERDLEVQRRDQAEARANELRTRLAQAEEMARELVASQQRKELEDAATLGELRDLKERYAETEAKGLAAQADAEQLRRLLLEAEQAADDALSQQKEVLEAVHAEDLRTIQELKEAADLQSEEARRQAEQLRRQLGAAEVEIEQHAAQQRELLSAEHAEEVARLRVEHAAAESSREEAAKEAANLRRALTTAQGAAGKLVQVQKEILSGQHAEELRQVQERHAEAERRRREVEADARELRRMLEDARRAKDAVAQEKDELIAARAEELRRLQLDRMAAEEEKAREAEEKRQKALADVAPVEAELEDLRVKHDAAEKKSAEAEAKAQELARRLQAAEQAAGEATRLEREAVDKQHEEELRRVRLRHEASEAAMDQVELRASELRERLSHAEAAMGAAAARQRELLDAEVLGTRPSPVASSSSVGAWPPAPAEGADEAAGAQLPKSKVPSSGGRGGAKTPTQPGGPGTPSKGKGGGSTPRRPSPAGQELPTHWQTVAAEAADLIREAPPRRASEDLAGIVASPIVEELEQRLAAAEQMLDRLGRGSAEGPSPTPPRGAPEQKPEQAAPTVPTWAAVGPAAEAPFGRFTPVRSPQPPPSPVLQSRQQPQRKSQSQASLGVAGGVGGMPPSPNVPPRARTPQGPPAAGAPPPRVAEAPGSPAPGAPTAGAAASVYPRGRRPPAAPTA